MSLVCGDKDVIINEDIKVVLTLVLDTKKYIRNIGISLFF